MEEGREKNDGGEEDSWVRKSRRVEEREVERGTDPHLFLYPSKEVKL